MLTLMYHFQLLFALIIDPDLVLYVQLMFHLDLVVPEGRRALGRARDLWPAAEDRVGAHDGARATAAHRAPLGRGSPGRRLLRTPEA